MSFLNKNRKDVSGEVPKHIILNNNNDDEIEGFGYTINKPLYEMEYPTYTYVYIKYRKSKVWIQLYRHKTGYVVEMSGDSGRESTTFDDFEVNKVLSENDINNIFSFVNEENALKLLKTYIKKGMKSSNETKFSYHKHTGR